MTNILDFFKSININLTFQSYYNIDKYKRIIFDNFYKDFKQETKEDIIKELQESYKYETNENLLTSYYNKLFETDNIIDNIYKIIEPKKPVIRKRTVYIYDSFGELLHTGIKQSYIHKEILQNWVNCFYDYNFNNNFE